MATQLRQQILSGRLAPQSVMPTERELGEAFGVGRTTVREALGALIASGFLVRRGKELLVRDTADVAEHDVNYAALAARISVEDLFETRKILEAKATELAARNWADDDIDELRSVLESMRGATGAEYHAADIEFHTTVVRLAKNAVLWEVYQNAKNLFFRLPAFWKVFTPTASAGKPITGYEGHVHIVEAIARRDAAEAVRLSDQMLDRVKRTLVERMNAAQLSESTGDHPIIEGAH